MTAPREPVLHGCPGCGALVRRTVLACRPCWFWLPQELRDAVNAAWRRRKANPKDPGAVRAHLAAVGAASRRLRDNPRGAA